MKNVFGKKSQIAVVITFVIAVLILLAAVFLNIARVSDIKTLTSQVADSSALTLASTLGSYSNLFIAQVGPSKEKCEANWNLILPLITILIGLVLMFFPLSLALIGAVFLGVGGYFTLLEINKYNKEGFAKAAQELTSYTAFREGAILSAMSAALAGDTSHARKAGGYVFVDEDGVSYNLEKTPIAHRAETENYLPRFTAWYYGKRFPLVTEEALAFDIKDLIDLLMENAYFFGDYWSTEEWRFARLAWGVDNVTITCGGEGSPCPEWVTPKPEDRRVIFLGPVELLDEEQLIKGQVKGFITEKFIDLAHRLVESYGDLNFPDGTFISKSGALAWIPPLPIIGDSHRYDDSHIYAFIEDMKGFLIRTMELANMPISSRLTQLLSWLRVWYDYEAHNGDGSSVDGDLDDDIYERLTRLRNTAEAWKNKLSEINREEIIPNLTDSLGTYCEQGRGGVTDTCYTEIEDCACWHEECDEYSCWKVCDGDNCMNIQDARWEGVFGTCTGTGFNHNDHPTCKSGDLYGSRPAWCDNLRADVGCQSNSFCGGGCTCCSIPPTNTLIDESYYYQGQLSWESPEADTEVEQAVEIFDQFIIGIDAVLQQIKTLADRTREVIYENEDVKRQAVYVWSDRQKATGKKIGYHMVRVAVGGEPGYPRFEDFPYITEYRHWAWPLLICKRVNGVTEGSFDFTVSRYDTDVPTVWWNLRRRRNVTSAEVPHGTLAGIESDVISDGKCDNIGAVEGIMGTYGIESSTRAYYGPSRDQIYIDRIR